MGSSEQKRIARIIGRITKHLGSYIIGRKYKDLDFDQTFLYLLHKSNLFSAEHTFVFKESEELLQKIRNKEPLDDEQISAAITFLGGVSVKMAKDKASHLIY